MHSSLERSENEGGLKFRPTEGGEILFYLFVFVCHYPPSLLLGSGRSGSKQTALERSQERLKDSGISYC